MNYKISKQAEIDLENIWLYTFEEWSMEQADYYFDLLMDEIEYISENPKSGTDYSNVRKGYFRTRIKSHFIFYKINLQEEKIEIIRILHQQMDVVSHF
ncbi:type II toxin-antitoxin system RelE/ParE family toxin [Epilithonimonas sp. JDS]|uniref:type II toxin-antitoxin system RelE/ParE family toxin n=1 Tax=Epilithonimonas sp. JDS TaxID=2902797 RepID=UPI001E3A7852|nr:type II toxin-antitoxin system RelE/ParE family toxin [Epilithonimonas sp. JDS]MCD9856032.1 type II toxin-antitoxin system RelE/ParE family toxin [Epilithonimonas sp. JDS]